MCQYGSNDFVKYQDVFCRESEMRKGVYRENANSKEPDQPAVT